MLSLHVGPDTVTRHTLRQLSVSGIRYWYQRWEYAANWAKQIGLPAAEALYQRFHRYPRHLNGATIDISVFDSLDSQRVVRVNLDGGAGWKLSEEAPSLGTALSLLAIAVRTAEVKEPRRLTKLLQQYPELRAIEARLKKETV